ncbi:MAG: hypothetical protein ACYDB7_04220 [Mycobacteriales bacterium]
MAEPGRLVELTIPEKEGAALVVLKKLRARWFESPEDRADRRWAKLESRPKMRGLGALNQISELFSPQQEHVSTYLRQVQELRADDQASGQGNPPAPD